MDSIAYHLAEVHSSVVEASVLLSSMGKRINYTTPSAFLDLLYSFRELYQRRQKLIFCSIDRLDSGINTLNRANDDVLSLQGVLTEKRKAAEQIQKEPDVYDELARLGEVTPIPTVGPTTPTGPNPEVVVLTDEETAAAAAAATAAAAAAAKAKAKAAPTVVGPAAVAKAKAAGRNGPY